MPKKKKTGKIPVNSEKYGLPPNCAALVFKQEGLELVLPKETDGEDDKLVPGHIICATALWVAMRESVDFRRRTMAEAIEFLDQSMEECLVDEETNDKEETE